MSGRPKAGKSAANVLRECLDSDFDILRDDAREIVEEALEEHSEWQAAKKLRISWSAWRRLRDQFPDVFTKEEAE